MKRRIFRYLHNQHWPPEKFHRYIGKANTYRRLQRQKPWIMAQWLYFRNRNMSLDARLRFDAFRCASSL